jgi:hypothetical protein
MNIQINPLQEQINAWTENYVPEKDLFFLREEDLIIFKNDLAGTLVIPRAEFSNHTSYNKIQWVNSYETWNVSMDAQYVIVAQQSWITSLTRSTKEALFHIQHKVGRGLIFPISYFSETEALPEDYVIHEAEEKFVIIQHNMWKKLPTRYKEELLSMYAKLWDEWTSTKSPTTLPAHLEKYANTFSANPGSNCLAAVLYAISSKPIKDEWIIHEWVHGETFALGLRNASFSLTEEHFQANDVVAWVNDEGIIQHAAYCIDGDLFFNKNGQTFFNPWKIVHGDELKKEWEKYTPSVYRKSY